jgi:hypothetical protein
LIFNNNRQAQKLFNSHPVDPTVLCFKKTKGSAFNLESYPTRAIHTRLNPKFRGACKYINVDLYQLRKVGGFSHLGNDFSNRFTGFLQRGVPHQVAWPSTSAERRPRRHWGARASRRQRWCAPRTPREMCRQKRWRNIEGSCTRFGFFQEIHNLHSTWTTS